MSDNEGDNNNAGGTALTGDDNNSDDNLDSQNQGDQDTGDTGEGEGGQQGSNDGDDTGEGSQTSPDTYSDFDLPEGMTLDEGLLESAVPIFKELALTQEQAQKLIDFQAKQVQESSQSQVDAFNQLKEDWLNEAKADKEIGGDNFDENVALAKNAIDKFGTPELKQLLNDHAIGNNIEIIRFMARVSRSLSEDDPSGETSPQSKEKDAVDLLYPNDRKES